MLAVAAVVAMAYAFREPLMEFVSWLGEIFKQGWEAAMAVAYQLWVAPWVELWEGTLRDPVMEFVPWVGEIFKQGWEAAMTVAYQLFVEPWVKLWETTLRDPVTKAWDWIKGAFVAAGENFMNNVVNPIRDAWQGLMDLLPNAMQSTADAVKGVWDGVMGAIKNAVNGAMSAVAGTINKVIDMINKVIDGVNALRSKVGWSAIAKIPQVSVPKFAQGGFVTGPTLAMVGDNPGGREYIVPESKAAGFANNIMAGRRGAAAIPATTGSSAAPVAAPINITTGPVMQLDGNRYVKVEDLERAVQQTQRQIYSTLRTPGGRRAMGLA